MTSSPSGVVAMMSKPNTRWRLAVGCPTLTCLLLPVQAKSQEVASSFEQLRSSGLLKRGDSVYVRDASGRRRKVRIRDLSSTVLTVTDGRTTRDLTETEVRRLDRRDSIENGIWIGLGISVAATVVFCKLDSACVYYSPYIYSAMAGSTVIGALVDLASHRTLYWGPPRSGASRLTLFPLLSKERIGVQMSLAW